MSDIIEAVAELGSGGGVGLGLVGVSNTVFLIEKSSVLPFTTTVPRRQMPFYHTLLSAVLGPPGLECVAVSTWSSKRWDHVALVCPRVIP